ncbi:hypothetical protein JOD64_003148 [Micromonospora luteifusca]|uniref:DUF4190 domain-containing protein n=1 Tax=Micromonospora luteifusca TaxID=709860 RepID=A0ABS2LUR5_9ACTN|nr:hypothetical protein [Micromonospora luteifusca]MBM7491926.1 hypothetical protein [Micromonospora luteifusca]
MNAPLAQRPNIYRGRLLAVGAGWLALVGSYLVLLPFFGVLSVVTSSVSALGWLWVAIMPTIAAVRLAGNRVWLATATFSVLAVLAGAGFWAIGSPQFTAEAYFRQHRHDLAQLASDFRTGRINGDADLPWRLRFLTIDGQAHRRCGFTDQQTGHKTCALYLAMWQDFHAESGGGIAYYPTALPPEPYSAIATASGDDGVPVRELGEGWWVVE